MKLDGKACSSEVGKMFSSLSCSSIHSNKRLTYAGADSFNGSMVELSAHKYLGARGAGRGWVGDSAEGDGWEL